MSATSSNVVPLTKPPVLYFYAAMSGDGTLTGGRMILKLSPSDIEADAVRKELSNRLNHKKYKAYLVQADDKVARTVLVTGTAQDIITLSDFVERTLVKGNPPKQAAVVKEKKKGQVYPLYKMAGDM
jgi:hypothetical protein